MSLKFVSSYPNATISISILFYDSKCAGKFVKQAWWLINDGETTTPYGGNLHKQNRYFYFFAEATDGFTWAGPDVFAVSAAHFNQCLLDDTNCTFDAGFIELDVGSNSDMTIELSASGWSVVQKPSGRGGGWDSDGTDGNTGPGGDDGGSGWDAGETDPDDGGDGWDDGDDGGE